MTESKKLPRHPSVRLILVRKGRASRSKTAYWQRNQSIVEPIPERASPPIPVLFIGDVGPAIRDRDPVERSNALLRTQSHAKDSQLVSGSSVFIALDFTSATPLKRHMLGHHL